MPELVKLKIYDLLRGAGSQFMGVRVWHSGVVVCGYEWFYGGGVTYCPEGEFEAQYQMQCETTEVIGETQKTIDEMRSWVARNEHEWTPESYKLFKHNCNHFANAFLKFLMDESDQNLVPAYVLEQEKYLPSFATPFLPIIESIAAGAVGDLVPGRGGTMPASQPPGRVDYPGMNLLSPQRTSTFPASTPAAGQPSTPATVKPNAFTRAVDDLLASLNGSLESRKKAVKLLHTLAKNIKENAKDERYRNINSSTVAMTNLLTLPHGPKCLKELGFEPRGDRYAFAKPVNRDTLTSLTNATHYCDVVLDELEQFENGQYAESVKQLKDMGFSHELQNFRALMKSQGRIDGALDLLFV